MVEKIICFGLGFATGCLYSSYKYDKNPNELVNLAKQDAENVGKEVVTKAEEAKDVVVSKFQGIKKSVNGVDIPDTVEDINTEEPASV